MKSGFLPVIGRIEVLDLPNINKNTIDFINLLFILSSLTTDCIYTKKSEAEPDPSMLNITDDIIIYDDSHKLDILSNHECEFPLVSCTFRNRVEHKTVYINFEEAYHHINIMYLLCDDHIYLLPKDNSENWLIDIYDGSWKLVDFNHTTYINPLKK